MTEYYMGISALHHDSAAALIDSDGNIICVSQEERRTGIKNDKSWPEESIAWCLRYATARGHKIEERNLTYCYYELPWKKFVRRTCYNPLKVFCHFRDAMVPGKMLAKKNYYEIMHHRAHALAGCATAPFDEGVYLTVDAIGEWNTTTWGHFSHKKGIKQTGKVNYPHSLGLLYSSFTRWLGLKPNEDEYIIMGAAAYGNTTYYLTIMEQFIELTPKGFKLKKNIHRGVEQYMGYEVPVEDWYDWCASIQAVCETVMEHLISILVKKYGSGLNLVLGGGVALNCVASSKILQMPEIADMWILPSPGDSGNAIGAAAFAAKLNKLNWNGPFLGALMDKEDEELSEDLFTAIVGRLERGEVIGWIQGREEFGPRALGHRSLLTDPRSSKAKDRVNAIKSRQSFRPFAPVILEEKAFSYFDMPGKPENHRYMQFTSRVRNPDTLPGISHVDDTARVQTVPEGDGSFRRLLERWDNATNCPVLLNTSLNIKSQPLMSKRSEAMRMLLDTPMDALVIGNILYHKINKPGLDDDMEIIVESMNYGNNNAT